ncbi:hypothetical protein INTERNEXUS_173 [Bacillus phage vB_BspM_Internexus]|nr:hypothetical protein INTERNEXUS_173 [Bacillus phage vB_BspM_Internexus]
MENFNGEKVTFARKLGRTAGNLFNKRVNKVVGRNETSSKMIKKNHNNIEVSVVKKNKKDIWGNK